MWGLRRSYSTNYWVDKLEFWLKWRLAITAIIAEIPIYIINIGGLVMRYGEIPVNLLWPTLLI
jgi:hypothetical protein